MEIIRLCLHHKFCKDFYLSDNLGIVTFLTTWYASGHISRWKRKLIIPKKKSQINLDYYLVKKIVWIQVIFKMQKLFMVCRHGEFNPFYLFIIIFRVYLLHAYILFSILPFRNIFFRKSISKFQNFRIQVIWRFGYRLLLITKIIELISELTSLS